MVTKFSHCNVGKVTLFMSDDRRARNIIVLKYSEKYFEIRSVSVIGAFYILMKNGMSLSEAQRYVAALETKEYKIYGINGETEKMSGEAIVEGISENKLALLTDGMLKRRAC